MNVYVDCLFDTNPSGKWPYKKACHMFVDTTTDSEVLHEFAISIGLRRSWYQTNSIMPHYDLTPNKRVLALKKGAVELDRNDTANIIRKYKKLNNIDESPH